MVGAWFPLAFLVPVLVFFQALLFGDIWLSFKAAKVAAAVFSVICIAVALGAAQLEKKYLQLSLLALAFVVSNILGILCFSVPREGVVNSLSAFLYNISLIVIFPGLVLLRPAKLSGRWMRGTFVFALTFVVAADIFGILQFVFNSYLLPGGLVSTLAAAGGLKFDTIGGHVRALSLFKSPLEFGMLNVFVAIYAFWAWCRRSPLDYKYLALAVLAVLSVISTISRTSMIMLFSGLFFSAVIRFRHTVLDYCRGVGLVAVLQASAVAVGVGFLIVGSPWGRSLGAHADLTNLYVRLNNWTDILGSIGTLPALLIGSGQVQNGAYGPYHSLVMDNMYVSQLIGAGLLGFAFFMALLSVMLWRAVSAVKCGTPSSADFKLAVICFFMAFLVGGMGENLTHFLFYPFYLVLQLDAV